jgi:hypothetical protein
MGQPNKSVVRIDGSMEIERQYTLKLTIKASSVALCTIATRAHRSGGAELPVK